MIGSSAPMAAYLAPPPGGLMLARGHADDGAAVAAADHASRHWQSNEAGALTPGTAEHRREVAKMFRETFNPYKPTIIDWPKLGVEERDRLVNLPIWNIAVQTEGKASLRMAAYAETLADPDWRGALELNGWEESRHKVVLANLVQAYGIVLEPEPAYLKPRDTGWAYLVTGFSECIDSFFALACSPWRGVPASSRPSSSIRSSRSCRRNAGTSCCSPIGWRRIAGRSAWPGVSGSSCASLRCGRSSLGSASPSTPTRCA